MREEHVNLNNIEVPDLYDAIKTHLQQDLKLDIIHEEKFDNYWSIKAYRGGKVNTITGSVRDVEVIISGTENNFDLVLRTGAWGRDIFVPGAIDSRYCSWRSGCWCCSWFGSLQSIFI